MDLQQIREHYAKTCGKRGILYSQITPTAFKVASARLYCHSWLCARCSGKKARKIAYNLKTSFENRPSFLLTLTTQGHTSMAESYKFIARAFNRLFTLVRQKYGRFNYFKVLEPQAKRGNAHYHIILDRYIDISWLRSHLVSTGFGTVCDVQLIRNDKIFSYVLKYLQKEWHNEQALFYSIFYSSRRYSCSRGLFAMRISSGKNHLLFYFSGSDVLVDNFYNMKSFIATLGFHLVSFTGEEDACAATFGFESDISDMFLEQDSLVVKKLI